MKLDQASPETLKAWESELSAQYEQYQGSHLHLDLTRGKPSSDQLALSDTLDGILAGTYKNESGTDSRNYGGLEGLSEMRQLGAEILGVSAEDVMAGGNSSLTLMYKNILFAYLFGPSDTAGAWKDEDNIAFICPVPGYDRHFLICEEFGIEMICVPMNEDGPDMDQVEALIKDNPTIKGMWNVPKYSNPTGIVYSAEVTERIAKLGLIASDNFRVFWDNAYVVHDLTNQPQTQTPIAEFCRKHGTEDSVIQFASTSKITHAGSGVAFVAMSKNNLEPFSKHLGVSTIGPDKVNHLRHAKFFPNKAALIEHMGRHASLLKPRFDCVIEKLHEHFPDRDLGDWVEPEGGYFVSFNTRPGLAKEVVRLASDAGVKLTPAGATFPYGKDPEDSNIRLAPSFPTVGEISGAMDVFATCVKLASIRQALEGIAD